MTLFGAWAADRERRRRAAAYVRAVFADPGEPEVRYLSETATRGDVDHARWEWRYARRAIGLLVAQRDALDDLTGSLVGHALSEALAHDPEVAVGMVALAERQFNERLAAYRVAFNDRGGELLGARLARVTLAFAGYRKVPTGEPLERTGAILSFYADEAHAALRALFGDPALPEDVRPSDAARDASRR